MTANAPRSRKPSPEYNRRGPVTFLTYVRKSLEGRQGKEGGRRGAGLSAGGLETSTNTFPVRRVRGTQESPLNPTTGFDTGKPTGKRKMG